MDIKRFTISNNQGIRSFKDILFNRLTTLETFDITEYELSDIAELEFSDTTVAKPFDNVVTDSLRKNHFKRIYFQMHKTKISSNSIFATNTRLTNSQKRRPLNRH